MTLSDLLYLCAVLAVVAGVAFLVGAFLGPMAALGAALIVLSFALYVTSQALANEVT